MILEKDSEIKDRSEDLFFLVSRWPEEVQKIYTRPPARKAWGPLF